MKATALFNKICFLYFINFFSWINIICLILYQTKIFFHLNTVIWSGHLHASCVSRSRRLLSPLCSTAWPAFWCCFGTGAWYPARAPCSRPSMPSLWWAQPAGHSVRNRASLQFEFLTQAVMCSPKVSLNAWFWSTVFHTRDTYLTEVKPSSSQEMCVCAYVKFSSFLMFKLLLFLISISVVLYKCYHPLVQVLEQLCGVWRANRCNTKSILSSSDTSWANQCYPSAKNVTSRLQLCLFVLSQKWLFLTSFLSGLWPFRKWTISVQQQSFFTQSTCAVSGKGFQFIAIYFSFQ